MGRRLGQHFLRDSKILDRIVEALGPEKDDRVLEIGPGTGSLTGRLLGRVARVVAIERDPALAQTTRTTLADPSLTVVDGDALEVEWPSAFDGAPFKVVGNIPYYIASPLIDRALDYSDVIVTVFLVQREVADRLCADAGTKAYGSLSVGAQGVAAVERLFVVKAGSFSPPPSVDSAVVRLVPLATPVISRGERREFRRFVTALFGQRRKQLVRSLREVTSLTRDEAMGALELVRVDPSVRVETLSPRALADLFHRIPR
jgi:16S rRNA (adenine1518-N6/adenine1519-N6)-dimethyltransferase